MPALSAADLRSRCAQDFRAFEAIRCATFHARPFASTQDANARTTLDRRSCEAGLAAVYHVTYEMPILLGRDHFAPRATIRFDLLAGGNYPFTSPVLTVVSRPYPWHPHVHQTSGIVCHGLPWSECGGEVLAAQLAVQIMRILNFERGTFSDSQYTRAAYEWWAANYDGPLNPDLTYPIVPIAEIARASSIRAPASFTERASMFEPLAPFVPRSAQPAVVFEPIGAPQRGRPSRLGSGA
jgi:hypothetical protein